MTLPATMPLLGVSGRLGRQSTCRDLGRIGGRWAPLFAVTTEIVAEPAVLSGESAELRVFTGWGRKQRHYAAAYE